MNKKNYEIPESDLIVIRIEDNFLNSVKSEPIQTLEFDDDELSV